MVLFHHGEYYANPVAFENRTKLHPLVQNLLDSVLIFIKLRFNKTINARITSTVSTQLQDALLHRTSTTHQEGRAFDLGLNGLSEKEIQEIKTAFTEVAGHLGAINPQTRLPTLIVDHDTGLGRHLHFQISKQVARDWK